MKCDEMHIVRGSGLLVVVVLLLTGCGGGSDKKAAAPATGGSVARQWTDTVRHGDYAAADSLFALPALVSNGQPATLTTRAQVDEFNRSFPCGAEITATADKPGGHTIATFTLVKAGPDRPCTGSVGGVAKVDFLIVNGKIKQWIRKAFTLPPGAQAA